MAASEGRSGRGRWARPFIAVCAALGAGVLLVAPMVAMEPRALPLAIVNLDTGVQTPQGDVNAGEQVVTAITAGDEGGLLSWKHLDTQRAIDDALAQNEVYAALIVPADFSASQVKAKQGQGQADALTLVVNEGKHPMVTSQLSGAIDELTTGAGAPITVTSYNTIPAAVGQAATVLPMLFMLLVYIASYAGGIVIRSTFPLAGAAPRRARTGAIQLANAAAAAAIVGIVTVAVTRAFVPALHFDHVGAAFFLALASFALMALVIGSINLVGMAGMIVPVAVLILGMGTANLPYEFLPAFWQDWVYPWNPLRYLADGSRALLFQGASGMNPATGGLLVTGLVGLALVAASLMKPAARASVNE